MQPQISQTFKAVNAMTNNTHNTILKMKGRKLLTHDKENLYAK